ncbi:MAG: 30S ribosome-binding factor RbfA [Vampirovibrionales bacterium]|nr:30S ribosome-binding factor RbfA [Vampirovibrionales bacterium]
MGHQEFSRADRVRKAMMREISDILASQVKDPLMVDKILSVTDIELARDFSHARVFLSMLGSDDEKAAVMEVIDSYTPRIRTEVGRRLQLRHTAKLVFAFDDSLERGARVNQLLKRIADGDEGQSG